MLLFAHIIDGRTDVLEHMKLVEDDLGVGCASRSTTTRTY
jgi:hypothetical protein